MDKAVIQAFDDKLSGASDDYRFGMRFLFWGARILTILFTLFPVQEVAEGFRMLPLITLYFSVSTAVTLMCSYTGIKEGGQNIRIYQKLRYLPISWEAYSRNRQRYVLRSTVRTTLIALACQLIMCLIAKEYRFGIWNVLYILTGIGVIPYLCAVLTLRSKKSKK